MDYSEAGMISYPVDEAHPIAFCHRTTARKMFEATTIANHAKRYVEGSLRISASAYALLVSSSGLSRVLRLLQDRALQVGDALHFDYGSPGAQNQAKGSSPSLRRNWPMTLNAIRLLMCSASHPGSSDVGNYDTTVATLHNTFLEPLLCSL